MLVAAPIFKDGEPVLTTAKNPGTSSVTRAGRKAENTSEKPGGTHLPPGKVALVWARPPGVL